MRRKKNRKPWLQSGFRFFTPRGEQAGAFLVGKILALQLALREEFGIKTHVVFYLFPEDCGDGTAVSALETDMHICPDAVDLRQSLKYMVFTSFSCLS